MSFRLSNTVKIAVDLKSSLCSNPLTISIVLSHYKPILFTHSCLQEATINGMVKKKKYNGESQQN